MSVRAIKVSVLAYFAKHWPWLTATTGTVLIGAGIFDLISQAEFGIITNGLQAIGVVLALGIGAATLRRDGREKRVDRVLDLHQELVSGDLWLARLRLSDHLSTSPDPINPKRRSVTYAQLKGDPKVSRYEGNDAAMPLLDADLLVRFFERANAVLRTRAADEDLFAELIGRHAYWWDRALVNDGDWTSRQPLSVIAQWFHDYVERSKRSHPERNEWFKGAERDFPRTASPPTAPTTPSASPPAAWPGTALPPATAGTPGSTSPRPPSAPRTAPSPTGPPTPGVSGLPPP